MAIWIAAMAAKVVVESAPPSPPGARRARSAPPRRPRRKECRIGNWKINRAFASQAAAPCAVPRENRMP